MKKLNRLLFGLLVGVCVSPWLVTARTYGVYPGQTVSTVTPSNERSRIRSNIQVGRNYSGRSRDVLFGKFYADNQIAYTAEGVFFSLASGTSVSDKNNDGQTDADDLSETFGDFKLYVNDQYIDYVPDFSVYRGRTGVWFDTSFLLPPYASLMIVGEINRSAENGDRIRFDLRRDGLVNPGVY